jgi:hypothetical protein
LTFLKLLLRTGCWYKEGFSWQKINRKIDLDVYFFYQALPEKKRNKKNFRIRLNSGKWIEQNLWSGPEFRNIDEEFQFANMDMVHNTF